MTALPCCRVDGPGAVRRNDGVRPGSCRGRGDGGSAGVDVSRRARRVDGPTRQLVRAERQLPVRHVQLRDGRRVRVHVRAVTRHPRSLL